MGEYASVLRNGKSVQIAKIGTCDDLRYTRREELVAHAPRDAGRGTNCRALLDHEGTLYRFPYPDEDDQRVGDPVFDKRDMFRTILLVFPKDLVKDKVDHSHKVVPMKPTGNFGWNINVWVPCPLGKDFDLKRSTEYGDTVPVTIYGERYDKDDNGRTIFRCGYCETPFSVEEEDLDHIRKLNGQYNEITDRLKARVDPQIKVDILEAKVEVLEQLQDAT